MTTRPQPGVGFAALLVAVIVVGLQLTTGTSAQQNPPTFKARVEVVQLDVSVLDKDRHPVRDLSQRDFTVLEDGKPRSIVGFTSVEVGDAPTPTAGWMRETAPDVATNSLRERRLFVIVCDDAMIPQDPKFIANARAIGKSIVDKIGPDDLTAVVFTADNRKTQDFTSDKTKLRAALDGFNPGLAGYRFGTDTNEVDIDLWFYQSAVRTLGNIADYLISVPNQRKVVFWLSPGVPVDPEEAALRPAPYPKAAAPSSGGKTVAPPAPSPGPPPPSDSPIAKTIYMRDLMNQVDDIYKRAQRANVVVYPIDPTGLGGMRMYLQQRVPDENTAFHKAQMLIDNLAQTASSTGGRVVMNTNDFEPGLAEVFDENSAYYLVGFESASAVADGKLHRVEVAVNRPGVTVRTRSGYYAPEPEKTTTKKGASSPESEALAKAIGGVLPNSGLPMRVSVTPFAVPGQHLATVAVVLGVRQPIPPEAAKGRVTETTELQTSAFTPEGDPRGTQRHTAKVVLRAGSDGEAAYEVFGRIDLAAGRYRLRLAAVNATSGKSGSVFTDVVVPDYSKIPFSASPIILSATPGRVSAPRDLLSPLLPVVPTAERDFTKTDKVTAFVRAYQDGSKATAPVALTITVRDDRDQVINTDSQTIGIGAFTTAATQVDPNAAPASPSPGVRPPTNIKGLAPSPTPPAAPADQFANLALRSADVRYELPIARLHDGPYLLSIEAACGSAVVKRNVQFQVVKER